MHEQEQEFLLGTNVNEPISIEVPVDVGNIDDLYNFLESIGFQITTDGKEKNKILIDKKPDNFGTYSIITPALKSEERKTFWDALKKALGTYEEIKRENKDFVSIGYPHIIDLKNLVLKQRQLPPKNEDKAQKINDFLKILEGSKDVIILDNKKGVFGNQLIDKGVFKQGDLLNGSTLPDPYSVATGTNGRFIRYASTDIGYAFGYSNVYGSKQINGYENLSPDGKNKLGFVFQYKKRQNQMFFSNAGIESSQSNRSESIINNETVVTRFDNPCIGIYLVWQSTEVHPKNTYMYKLNENDPMYRLFKEYYAPSNARLHDVKNERFTIWNNEDEKHQTYMPGNLEQIKENIENLLKKRDDKKKKIADQQTKIDEIIQSILSIRNEIYRWNNIDISNSSYVQLTTYVDIKEQLNDQEAKLEEREQKIKDTVAKLNGIKAEIDSNDYLKQPTARDLSSLESVLASAKENLKAKKQDWQDQKNLLEEGVKERINKFIQGTINLPSRDYNSIPFKIRKEILIQFTKKAPNISGGNFAEKIINVYMFAKPEERKELLNVMQDIYKNSQKGFRKELNQYLKGDSHYPDATNELIKLFRENNAFYKAINEVKKILAFKHGNELVVSRNKKQFGNNIKVVNTNG